MIANTPTLWSPHVRSGGSGARPSEKALLSLLVFGGLAPGHAPYGGATDANKMAAASGAALAEVGTEALPEDIRERATHLLDAELERVIERRRPVLLFSGGVDSSLMAARLVALGRTDVSLIHYQFHERDPETVAAHKVADQLGLAMTVVEHTDGAVAASLAAPGEIYPIPFGDQSAPATAELCRAVIESNDPDEVVVLDGSGADGAFGLGRRAMQAHRDSALIRAGLPWASAAYSSTLWRAGGRAEHIGRVLRRVHKLGPVAAAIAQNALFGVLYDGTDLPQDVARWSATMDSTDVGDPVERVVVTDLAITVARIFAQKTHGPLTSAEFTIEYPYLVDPLVALGVRHTAQHPGLPAKAWMKKQLARHIDSDLVDRKKQGFIDPGRRMFDDVAFRAALADALRPEGVFADRLRAGKLRRWIDTRPSLARVPVGHQNLLWTLTFVDRWYRTHNDRGTS